MALSFNTPEDRYEYLRKRAEQQGLSQGQAGKEAMARKFAAMGQSNSGQQMKMESMADDKTRENIQAAQEGINMQEQQDKFARDEAEKQRLWGTSERVGSQLFGAAENMLARQFGAKESQKQRLWQAQEAEKQRNTDNYWKNKTLNFEKTKWGQQYDQILAQFEEDKRVTDFNMDMANKIFNKKTFMDRMNDMLTPGKWTMGKGWGKGFSGGGYGGGDIGGDVGGPGFGDFGGGFGGFGDFGGGFGGGLGAY